LLIGTLRRAFIYGKGPSDASLRKMLGRLRTTHTLPRSPISRSEYRSVIPGVSPERVKTYFLQNPNDLLRGEGINVRPATGSFQHGTKAILEDGKIGGLWAPIEVLLPNKNTIVLGTLDGHPFRGTNTFEFLPDGKGGTVVKQTSLYQASSELTELGFDLQDAEKRQRQLWSHLHQRLFDFAGT
jgi:hypothetical protein